MRLLSLFERDTSVLNDARFKRWFGNSVVVNNDGSPRVVYHGTGSDFTAFRGMVWASAEASLPSEYAAMRQEWNNGAANVIPLFMSIQKPFNADYLPKAVTVADIFNALLEQAGYDESNMPENIRETVLKAWHTVDTGRREEESGPHYNRHDFWNGANAMFGAAGAQAILDTFKLLGYDGVQMIEDHELTFGAFNPNQVKSIFNSGEFNPDSDMMSESNLMELRGYTAPGVSSNDAQVIAWRGYYWLLPNYSNMDSVPEDDLYQIARTIGMEDFEDGDDGSYFMDLIGELTENRPDIIYGTINNGTLYFQPMGSGAQSPVTSNMMKKLAQELNLNGIEVGGTDWYGDEDQSYVTSRSMEGKIPEHLYHGTTSSYMRSIMRTGIRPGASESNWKAQGIEHDSLIFGATTLEGATFHANKTAGLQYDPEDNHREPDDPFPVILQFKVPDPNRIVPDYDVAGDVVGQTDQTDRLGYTNKAGYARFSNADEINRRNPEGRLWKSASVFGYQGRVPASYITQVYSNFFEAGPLTGEYMWSGTLEEFYEEYDRQYQDYYGAFDDEDY